MINEYLIRYSYGWIWKKYWLVFNDKYITLFDDKKKNSLKILYKDISHVFKQPLSLTQIDIYCTVDILKDYPPDEINWFPPKPVVNPKVYWFSVHIFKRNDVVKSFDAHGIKTSISPISWKDYWEDIRKKWNT